MICRNESAVFPQVIRRMSDDAGQCRSVYQDTRLIRVHLVGTAVHFARQVVAMDIAISCLKGCERVVSNFICIRRGIGIRHKRLSVIRGHMWEHAGRLIRIIDHSHSITLSSTMSTFFMYSRGVKPTLPARSDRTFTRLRILSSCRSVDAWILGCRGGVAVRSMLHSVTGA